MFQVGFDTPDGRRFSSFYKVEKCPFICILDPRTGENQYTIPFKENFNGQHVIVELYDFIKTNGTYPDSGEPTDENGFYNVDIPDSISPSSFIKTSVDLMRPSTSKGSSSSSSSVKSEFIDLSEEEQYQLAIAQSLAIVISDSGDSSDDEKTELLELEDVISTPFTRDKIKDENVEPEIKSTFLINPLSPITSLHLRFPDDEKLTLKWPASTPFNDLKSYLIKNYREIFEAPHKIIMTHPTRDLCLENHKLSFQQLGLHPSATLYVQPDC